MQPREGDPDPGRETLTGDDLLLDLALSLRRRTARDPGDTARRILGEAILLFATRGYRGTSMRDIGAAVGIKPASIYSHFESKEQVLTEALADTLHEFHSFLLDAVEAGRPAREQLEHLVRQHIRWQLRFRPVAGSWDVLWEIEADAENLHATARDAIRERRDRYHALVEALVASVRPGDDARRRAEAILVLCDRAPTWAAESGSDRADEEVVSAAWATIESLLE